MWALLKRFLKTGIVSEPLTANNEDSMQSLGHALEKAILKRFSRSLAIRLVDAGSCNACELEVNAACNPLYNLERFGIRFVASPRHADMLLVTGPVTLNMADALQKTYEATPDPKLVVALGDCAHCGGIFKDSPAVKGGVSHLIPVDVTVPGCPPTPIQIIRGILTAINA